MNKYKLMAEIFYKDHKNYSKAIAAATLLDNRLKSNYMTFGTDIHFDIQSFNKYFDYDRLADLPNYSEKLKTYYQQLNKK